MLRCIRTEDPAFEAVTLADLKAQCRVDHADEDGYLGGVLAGAMGMIDGPEATGFCLAEQTWVFYFDAFPSRFRLPVWPVMSVDAVEYKDEAGDWQAVDTADWVHSVAGYPIYVEPAKRKCWPTVAPQLDHVRVTATLGHAAVEDVPGEVKAAVKMLAAHWYSLREPVSAKPAFEVPLMVQRVLDKISVNLSA